MSTTDTGAPAAAGAGTSPLDRLEALAALEHYLAVAVTTNADATPQVAVVNIGVVSDPATSEPRLGFVARQGAKLANLRQRPQATIVVRAGWEWIAASGPVTLAGPDDPAPGVDQDALVALLRDIFHAAGGHHPNLDRYDAVMAAERRCAVLLAPTKFVTNPAVAEHRA